MIAEIGHFALLLALGVSLLLAVVPLIGAWRHDLKAMRFAGTAALVQLALVVVAYACLTTLFVQGDFSVTYVAQNSHSELPLAYRISAVWGGHEGSLLLWILMLAGWTAAVAAFNRRLPAEMSAIVLAVLGAIMIGFLLFTVLTSNPFDRLLPIPADGSNTRAPGAKCSRSISSSTAAATSPRATAARGKRSPSARWPP